MIPGIFKTRGNNPENGKPNIVALMLDESQGVSLDGGALAAGVYLTFGGEQSFNPTQWVELSEQEYGALLESQVEVI